MVYWKNRKLSELTRIELQLALQESINNNFEQQQSNTNLDIFSTFVFGLLTGASIAMVAVLISFI